MTNPITVTGTDPYPWPYDGGVARERVALLVAGLDADWTTRSDATTVEPTLSRLVAAATAAGVLVVGIAHGAAIAVTTAAIAVTTAAVPNVDLVVRAAGIDGFHGGPLDATLRTAGITHLVLSGYGLEAPVHSTLRSANDRGYECLLVGDACAPLDTDVAAAALHMVTMSGGIFGAIGTSDAVIAALDPTTTPPTDPTSQEQS